MILFNTKHGIPRIMAFFTISKSLSMSANKIPSTFFPILQVKVINDVQRLGGSACIFKDEIIVAMDDVECCVRLREDRLTILLHARGPANSSRACRVLMARLRLLVSEPQIQMNEATFISFQPFYANSTQLSIYERNPELYSTFDIFRLRRNGHEYISNNNEQPELITKLLGIESLGELE